MGSKLDDGPDEQPRAIGSQWDRLSVKLKFNVSDIACISKCACNEMQ